MARIIRQNRRGFPLRRMMTFAVVVLLLGFSFSGSADNRVRVLDIRSLSTPAHMAQLVIDLSEPVDYKLFTLQPEAGKAYRVVVDLHNTRLVGTINKPTGTLVRNIRSASRNSGDDLRVVLDVRAPVKSKALLLPPSGRYGHRLVLTLEDSVQTAYNGFEATATLSPPPPIAEKVIRSVPPPRPVETRAPVAKAKAVAAVVRPQARTPVTQSRSGARIVYSAPAEAPKSAPIYRYTPTRAAGPQPAQRVVATKPVVQAARKVAPAAIIRGTAAHNVAPAPKVMPAATPVAVKPRPPVPRQPRQFVIAVDAGHGGIDPGATGPSGVHEKDVVLSISRELAHQINRTPGMRAVLIRDGDVFLRLRDRIERARTYKADVFISIHADAFEGRSDFQGSSVYMLSPSGASSEAAKWLAERENGADLLGGTTTVSLSDKSDVLASILLDLSQTGTLDAGARLAEQVLTGLRGVGPVYHRKVQQAAFMVLRSPDIPSILVETAFISNPQEERKLSSRPAQRKMAAAILRGLKNYFANYVPADTLLARQ